MLEKGKQPGSHLLSGAVDEPARASASCSRGGSRSRRCRPTAQVHGEAVYLLTKGAALRIPPPPTMTNHGNWIVSLSELGRFLAEQAEAGGRDDPARDGRRRSCSSTTAASSGVRTGDKGRGKEGEPLGELRAGRRHRRAGSPCSPRARRGTSRPPRSTTSASTGGNPQIWALGVKEVWRSRGRCARIVHTMGWPLRKRGAVRRVRRLVDLPDGRRARLDRVRRRARVRRRRALRARPPPGVQDAPARPQDPRRRRARRVGREDDHRGRPPLGARRSSTRPGCCSSARAPGSSTCRGSRACTTRSSRAGSPPRRRSRRSSAARSRDGRGALDAYDDGAPRELRLEGARARSGTCARSFDKGFFMGGALASAMTVTKGKLPPKDYATHPNADDAAHPDRARGALSGAGRHADVRQALVGLRLGQPHARRPAEPHPRRDERAARPRGDVGLDVPGAGLRGGGGGRRRHRRRCVVNPSNCVQCGAITAKGGRLTPPEGGSGPEYTRHRDAAAGERPRFDVAVVGAGDRRARHRARARPRAPVRAIAVLDKEQRVGAHQTGHSSGVIHRGVYYAPGSLKARLCVAGAARLLAYCERARDPDPALRQGGRRHGRARSSRGSRSSTGGRSRTACRGVELIGARAARASSSRTSPASGRCTRRRPSVVDFGLVAEAYADDVRAAGGEILLGREVQRSRATRGRRR